MITKVKGEAIKEGSIPMSALSTEVKDKIENAGGGADWNAQEGEVGYIQNKPFGFSYIGDTHFGDNEWETYENIYLYVAKRSHNDTYLTDYGYIRFYDGMSHTFDIDGGDGKITVYNDGCFPRIISQDYFDTEEQAAEFLNNVLKVVGINELDNAFLADTVVKTTPQSLEVEEMHQALSNLGIDPVVWKYVCNPYVLNILNPNAKLPMDLVNICFNDDGSYNPIMKNLLVIGAGDDVYSITEMLLDSVGVLMGGEVQSIVIHDDGSYERI